MIRWLCAGVLAFTLACAAGTRATSRLGRGSLDALVLPRGGHIADYSSYDRKFGNDDFRAIAPGQTITLVDHRGAGIVRRWWLTIAPLNNREIQRQLIVRCYWDGETEPSVEVPAGSFAVAMNQPLARLAFYLIAPTSDDGLTTWNFLDDMLGEGVKTYPIYRKK